MLKKISSMLVNFIFVILLISSFDYLFYFSSFTKISVMSLEIKNEINNFLFVREEVILFLENNEYVLDYTINDDKLTYKLIYDYKPMLKIYKTSKIIINNTIDLKTE